MSIFVMKKNQGKISAFWLMTLCTAYQNLQLILSLGTFFYFLFDFLKLIGLNIHDNVYK